MLSTAKIVLLVALCCVLVSDVSSAKRRGLQKETIDRANTVLRENPHREALAESEVVGERFLVELDGVTGDETSIVSCVVDPVEIPPIEMGAESGGQQLVFCPGQPKFGDITLSAVKGSDLAQQMQKLWDTAVASGDRTTVDVSVKLLAKDGTPARTWNLFECWPKSWDLGDYDSQTNQATETMVLGIGRIVLSSEKSEPPKFDDSADFGVTLEDPDGNGFEDTAWESCVGGSLNLHAGALPECFNDVSVLPNTDVTSLQLRGPVAGGREQVDAVVSAALLPDEMDEQLVQVDAMLAEMEKQVAALRLTRRTLREQARKHRVRVRSRLLGDDTTYEYADCFVTRYVFPSLAASGTGNLYEEVTLKPIRLELA